MMKVNRHFQFYKSSNEKKFLNNLKHHTALNKSLHFKFKMVSHLNFTDSFMLSPIFFFKFVIQYLSFHFHNLALMQSHILILIHVVVVEFFHLTRVSVLEVTVQIFGSINHKITK